MAKKGRSRGHIRQRGRSFHVFVYAGMDPITGKEIRLTGSAKTEAEAKEILRRLRAQVDDQRAPKTKASFRVAMDAWLRVLDVEETTRASYEDYTRVHLNPAFGDEPISRITAHVLETLYAELRRCRVRCNRRPQIGHRVQGEHECRTVKHRRPPGRRPAAGYPPHDCAEVGCVVLECKPHVCQPLAPATIRRIHFTLRGVLSAAVRWGWINTNPAAIARSHAYPRHSRTHRPSPTPPGSPTRHGLRTTTGERSSGLSW